MNVLGTSKGLRIQRSRAGLTFWVLGSGKRGTKGGFGGKKRKWEREKDECPGCRKLSRAIMNAQQAEIT